MEKSVIPSSHILIRSSNTSDFDKVDFEVVELSTSLKETIFKSATVIQLLSFDRSFHCLNYWDFSVNFYCNSPNRLYTEEIIPEEEDWTYIIISPAEEKALIKPQRPLEGHQMIITRSGLVYFSAFTKYSMGKYFTEPLSIKELLKNYISESLNSS